MKTLFRVVLITTSSFTSILLFSILKEYTNIDDSTIMFVSIFVTTAIATWVALYDAYLDNRIEKSKHNLDISVKDLIISVLKFALVKSEAKPAPIRKGKNWAKGTKHSEETKRKISEKAKAREEAKRQAKGPTEVKITPRRTTKR